MEISLQTDKIAFWHCESYEFLYLVPQTCHDLTIISSIYIYIRTRGLVSYIIPQEPVWF